MGSEWKKSLRHSEMIQRLTDMINNGHLECDCGIFIPAPLNPNENNRVTCGGCGIVWRGVDGPADSCGNTLAPGSWEKCPTAVNSRDNGGES